MTVAPTPAPEFSCMVDRRQLTAAPLVLRADDAQRAALAQRFGIVAVKRLEATVSLIADGEAVNAAGTLEADIVQSCAVSGEDLPVEIREPLTFRFVPDTGPGTPDEEIELDGTELDEIPYSGTAFDLGEAVAESLALAIDPYATGPEADAVREKFGLNDEGPKGPLAAALAALVKKD
ncbi:YceD family protein [Alteraurantiacibacter palmitatis]|uniref:DUF177 domain-containing protein n=1 Tax=Alteraurantiacibacter palmitatis TaxID=2054628 RepID=A0ABV7E4Z6_9SPHN